MLREVGMRRIISAFFLVLSVCGGGEAQGGVITAFGGDRFFVTGVCSMLGTTFVPGLPEESPHCFCSKILLPAGLPQTPFSHANVLPVAMNVLEPRNPGEGIRLSRQSWLVMHDTLPNGTICQQMCSHRCGTNINNWGPRVRTGDANIISAFCQ